ncbi:carboxymuconolactone decarboxylase family protein [uncultured Metabacillus sp.]|uniref:carboxymuconolactone decarboxylase family protein n=1 Tax=Metabacillus sp. Hm71 TaxID=3450743 RepID=UPI002608AAED|nr:carboxymuconolactone decarboxylase family protein [uncultured Metabacillus sp.]
MADDTLYKLSYLNKLGELKERSPQVAQKFMQFEHEVFQNGEIPTKTKELIAIAVAHTTGCPYCIEAHVAKYKKLGGTMEEVIEAIAVAAALKAGAAISHSVNAINAYERN